MSTVSPVLLLIFAALFGSVFGSFLNVCIVRMPEHRSVVWPPSACGACGRRLEWFENLPVVAWLALGGRCRTCHAPVSVRYLVVEMLTAAMFVAGMWWYGPGWLLASRLVFGCILIVLFATDLEHQLLPDAMTLPGIVIGFAFSFVTAPGWVSSLIGLLAGGGVLLALAELYARIRHEDGLGGGDVKMLAMMGAFLGWEQVLLALMFASFAGSAVGLSLVALGRGDMKHALPFGTFLAVGAAVVAVAGDAILRWYLGPWAL